VRNGLKWLFTPEPSVVFGQLHVTWQLICLFTTFTRTF